MRLAWALEAYVNCVIVTGNVFNFSFFILTVWTIINKHMAYCIGTFSTLFFFTCSLNNYKQAHGILYCTKHFQEHVVSKNTQTPVLWWITIETNNIFCEWMLSQNWKKRDAFIVKQAYNIVVLQCVFCNTI